MTEPPSPPVPADVRLVNRLGALATAIHDRIDAATEDAVGKGAALPAALSSLRQFTDGGTVDQLRAMVGLTHSGAVRLADRLVDEGHVQRRPGPDGRSVALVLTPQGRAAADRVAQARADAVAALVASLAPAERATLLPLVDRLVSSATEARLAERADGGVPRGGALCRLCDATACDRAGGDCPAATTAAGHAGVRAPR